ncbi:MAG TPA: hypothetical protein VKY19_02285 [Ktedonosporobacter sp.]|jgi:hypothetical protein|nr:hypothetical protein [Ktedonosporobacter sp.]
MRRFSSYRKTVVALIFMGLVLLISSCGSSSGDSYANLPYNYLTPTGSPVSLSHYAGGTLPAKPTAAVTPGGASAPVGGVGGIPAGFPRYFSFGVMNAPGAVAALDGMRQTNGAAFTFRYQYLSGGVNTGHGWETWNQPAGQFATFYMQESAQHGYIPTFVYYELCQSNGPQLGSYCGGHDSQQDHANLTDPATMAAYFANWALLLQKIKAFGRPVLVVVEPDLWGFLEQADGSRSAASVPASVASSGYAAVAGFPNTAQGFSWALLHLRDIYASNAILALHASLWATNTDIGSDTRSSLDVAALAQQEANFLNSVGLVGNPAGVSSWDLLSNDVADHDSAQPGGRSWWDRYNLTFPNFARYLDFMGRLCQQTRRRAIMWQVPMGNQYFDTMNNTQGHYQDNRPEYILSHVSDFANAGIIGVLFGPGNGGTMNIDAMHDGITNPAPIASYECDHCNTHTSIYPDDDGGYLRIYVGIYLQHPVAIA